jgi:hypothetical protein
MAENTTGDAVLVVGQRHEHPALRRLARACIALVRWQRAQVADVPPDTAPDEAATGGIPAKGGHD